MGPLRFVAVPLLASMLAVLGGCSPLEPAPRPPLNLPAVSSALREPLQPLPTVEPLDGRKTQLGAALFRDQRLSHDQSVACSSCHDLAGGGGDHRPKSIGVGGRLTVVNTPTVFNAAVNGTQFWNGRARSVEQVVDAAMQGETIMGSTWPEVVGRLKADASYTATFSQIYRGDITPATVTDALTIYIRSLTTPNARLDRFLLGDTEALSATEQEGYRLFKSYGCVSCHQGANVGGNLFQKLGVVRDYFGSRGGGTIEDLGRFNVTGNEQDRYVFRVPSLRNVALTAPYLHDGSAPNLETVVSIMGRYQLGRQMSPGEINTIVQFLSTLTGEQEEGSAQ